MRSLAHCLIALAAVVATVPGLTAADKQKRLLLVTHSGGFIHDSVGVAEDVLKEVGAKHGYAVTCYRLTNPADPALTANGKKDPKKAVEDYSDRFRQRTGKMVDAESTGKIDKETLKNFDVVLFFTTGNPMTPEQTKDLVEWVKAGGAFAGTHCATDTLYGDAAYGHLIGGYFRGHPAGIQNIKVKVDDPKHRMMQEEIFGPVVTVYPYSESWSDVLDLVDTTSPYALTGAVFANDRTAVREAEDRLRQAAGNFYVNDKPTGAVVCQQPFGGARQSGTNDKAGYYFNVLRWMSPRSIKENLSPPTDYRYPFLAP